MSIFAAHHTPRQTGGQLAGRCLCGVTRRLASKAWWDHLDCGFKPRCRYCRRRAVLVRYRIRSYAGAKAGWFSGRICYRCWQDPSLRQAERRRCYQRRFKSRRPA